MKSRGVLIAGNWKMNLGPTDTEKFFSAFKALSAQKITPTCDTLLNEGRLRAWVIPPFLSLSTALQQVRGTTYEVGAQNVHWEKSGAFTGEISGPMLKELGIEIALVGHSERRQYFGETDETARKRTESLLEQGFQVILCIGETRAERESNQTEAVLLRQLQGAIPEAGKGAARFLTGQLILAYEPVWAIGTGLTATPAQAEDAHRIVRTFLRNRFGAQAADKTPILYGGSVTPDNVDALLSSPEIDGALVGGASLKPESYLTLVVAGARALS